MVEFNCATGDRMLFEECEGCKFITEIRKEHRRTCICGVGWEDFIRLNNRSEGVLLCFVLDRPVPKLQICVVAPPPNQADLALEAAVFTEDIKKKARESAKLNETLLYSILSFLVSSIFLLWSVLN
ncbi:hypothetical protein ACQJBY_005238 [Aegilops geniculata]